MTTITLDRNNLIAGVLPRLSFIDQPSYVQSSTKEYDKVCHDETQCVCVYVCQCWVDIMSLTDNDRYYTCQYMYIRGYEVILVVYTIFMKLY